MLRLLIMMATLVAEHRLHGGWTGIWDFPRPGIEPLFPALAGGFCTTGPPGKPLDFFLSTFIEV